jgi:voltage-gated potassium channel
MLPDSDTARRWVSTAGAIVGIVTLYFVIPYGRSDDPLPTAAATAIAILITLVLALLISRRIVRVLDGVPGDGLSTLMILLTGVIMAFSVAYLLLARSDPAQVAGLHTRLDALYFTLTTITTVGYGDIHPAGQEARAISSLQTVFDVIFVAGLVRASLQQAIASRKGRDQL